MESAHCIADSLHKLKDVKNYNKWIYDNIKAGVSGSVIEFGCGIGNITDFIINDSIHTTGIDISDDFVSYAEDKYKDNPKVKVAKGDLMNISQNLKDEKYDTAVLLNVLEHIEDDGKVVKNIAEVLKENGKLLMLVPAMQSIYGTMDKALGHFKRYNKKDMKVLLQSNGYKINKMFYMNGFGYFGWFYAGRILRSKTIPEKSAIFFDRVILPVAKLLEKIVKPVFGQSLIVIAEKIK